MKRISLFWLSCLIWGLVFCFATSLLYISGVRLNISSSLPHVLWLVRPLEDGEDIKSGDFVVVAPSEIAAGKSYDRYIRETYFGTRDFLKRVSGTSGDVIHKDFEIFSADSAGHELPQYPLPTVLRSDEYWLTSDKERGFDSRYFGPVNRRAIKAKAKPLF